MHFNIYDVCYSQCSHLHAGLKFICAITLNRLHNINFQDFNNYLFLTYIYSMYMILTDIIILIVKEGW